LLLELEGIKAWQYRNISVALCRPPWRNWFIVIRQMAPQ